MIDNLATFASPPPALNGAFLGSLRLDVADVERRCPGIKCWIDRARMLVVFGPERQGGMVLFAYAVPLFKNQNGRLHPMGFKGADSVDRVVDRINSAKMPEHAKLAIERQRVKDEESSRENALQKAIEDRRPEADRIGRWIRWNLNTESKFRKYMGLT